MLDKEHDQVDISSIKTYDKTLCKYVKVTLIEKVKVNDTDSQEVKEAKCEAREGFWQTQLKTLQIFGGLNKRDNRKYVTARKYAGG